MDADKIKNFFIHHAEKMVVAIVIAASAWMVYGGLNLPDMRQEQDPARLAQDAQQVRATIDEDHNEQVLADREPTFKIQEELEKKNQYVDFKSYSLDTFWVPQNVGESTRRQDPTLLAPRALMVSGHIESYAVLSTTGAYAASRLENADPVEKIEAKKVVRPRQTGRRARAMMGMDGMMEGEMDGMGMMGSSMMMESSGMGTSGMMDASSMMTGSGRKLDPKYNFGYSPAAATAGGKKAVPQSAWFIAGTAVVPHESIVESYRAALPLEAGFLPQRDQPLYFNYEIQRATVTDKSVDELVDADWVMIGNRESDLKRAAFVWAGFAPELVPADYRDLNITGYIPPILLSDYSTFALHPLIPMKSRQELEQAKMMEESKVAEVINPEDMKLANPGQLGGLGSMDSGMDYDMGMDMSMDMEMGMSMGMGVASGMTTIETNPVQYKIMRFYDFARGGDKLSPLPGQKYVYRIRYAVQDPNFPANPLQQPKSSTLGTDVYARVQGLIIKATETKKREFQRWSEWSEPSPPVSLPGLTNYFAGSVEAPRGREYEIAGKKVEYQRSPPKANVLNLTHNPKYAAPMPIWMSNVTEGSALSYTGTGEIIDPITLTVKKVDDAQVFSGSTIIDLAGGRPLEIVDKEELTEPGLMLLFDEFGGLRVESEVQDQEEYRIYSFADERGL